LLGSPVLACSDLTTAASERSIPVSAPGIRGAPASPIHLVCYGFACCAVEYTDLVYPPVSRSGSSPSARSKPKCEGV
jgi:hypothetical protein